ncbi:ABC transporter permease [Arvimicrobium flavum]|uniref:ABC transporter permease n=1 Tax=Arvimicrobium flavum TaxID=3393320 RepID=UPI00237A1F60|nr:ABC transporter permease [Mesorhizobium shangrilense]
MSSTRFNQDSRAAEPRRRTVGGAGFDFSNAIADIVDGARRHELWSYLAWSDTRQRYERSIIGPLWMTINMGIMVGALGVLYSTIFKQDISTYMPYLAIGIVLWGLISAFITEGCMTFISSGPIIRNIRAPLSIFAFYTVWRNVIVFLHNMLIYVLVAIFFGIWPTLDTLYILPAAVLYCINAFWVCLLLGLLCARFRDIPLLVTSLMQILFFFTPVIWTADLLPDRAYLVHFNPFYHFLEIGRRPLLAQPAALENWLVVLACTVLGLAVTMVFYARYRSRVAYWI